MRSNLGIKRRFGRLFNRRRGRPTGAARASASWEAVVEIIYQAALARGPDSSGLAAYAAAMRSGAMLPLDALAEVKNSHEGHRARTLDCTSLIVAALYEVLLNREPTHDEVVHWRARAASSGGVGEVVRGIMALPEAGRVQLNNALGSQGMQTLFLAEYRRTGVIDA